MMQLATLWQRQGRCGGSGYDAKAVTVETSQG